MFGSSYLTGDKDGGDGLKPRNNSVAPVNVTDNVDRTGDQRETKSGRTCGGTMCFQWGFVETLVQ